jgi:hypothetical protein
MTTKLQDFLNSPIPNVSRMGKKARQGDLWGIELECEGRNVSFNGEQAILDDWAPHADGSLRANHGDCCEWVFNGPVKLIQAQKRVHQLFEYFEKNKAKLVTSNRTSTHVHFNMGDKNAYQLVNMFILFTILEEIMDRFCGEDRVGNLFCLSSRYAEAQIDWMFRNCFNQYIFNWGEAQRYCSFNMAAICKFGTVEFRAMRGLDNKDDLLDWLGILSEFCDYGCYKMQNPVDTINSVSMLTPRGFVESIFSKRNADLLLRGLSEDDLNRSVYEGLRLVQMLAYKVGTEFDQVRLRGRDFWASFSDHEEPIKDVDPAVAGVLHKARAGNVPRRAGPGGGLARAQRLIIDPEGQPVWEHPAPNPVDVEAEAERVQEAVDAILARRNQAAPQPQPQPGY